MAATTNTIIRKLLYLAASLYLLASITAAIDPHEICGTQGYDVSDLIKAKYWQFNTTDHCINITDGKVTTGSCVWFMTFCSQLQDSVPGCVNSSVCQTNLNDPDTLHSVGAYVPHKNPFEEDRSGNGFLAGFPHGLTLEVGPNNQTCNMSVLFEFNCNRNQVWQPVALGSGGNEPSPAPSPDRVQWYPFPSCAYHITFNASFACMVINPSARTFITENLSAGTVIIIIAFVTMTFYFIFGMAINYILLGQRGNDVVPNSSFWCGLPIHIIAGCQFFSQCIMCKTADTDQSKYDNIE